MRIVPVLFKASLTVIFLYEAYLAVVKLTCRSTIRIRTEKHHDKDVYPTILVCKDNSVKNLFKSWDVIIQEKCVNSLNLTECYFQHMETKNEMVPAIFTSWDAFKFNNDSSTIDLEYRTMTYGQCLSLHNPIIVDPSSR